jgi:hypothetical protein
MLSTIKRQNRSYSRIRFRSFRNRVYRMFNPAQGLRRALLRSRRAAIAASLVGALSAASQPAHPVTQSELEAVYLYNFAKFVNWPPEAAPLSAPFSICTLGNDDLKGALDAVTSSESLQGHKIVVRHLASIAEAEGCHILFIAPSEDRRLSKDLSTVKVKPILTVSSAPSFLEHGGMIQFIVQDKRVRFAVNLAPALEAHLTVSSELLKVALTVHGKPAEEAK